MGKSSKVLVVGGGGREHALSWKLAQSKHVDTVYVAPGNPGSSSEAKIVNIEIKATDIEQLIHFANNESIDLIVVGPEDPLVAGIVDKFTKIGIKCFGPTAEAAQLEGSKAFAKRFMQKYSIPTATYQFFSDPHSAKEFLKNSVYPMVIKADGLAAGKGVFIVNNFAMAEKSVDDIMTDQKFGSAGATIVVEEFLEGEEASFIAMVDGVNILPLATSQDHKAIGDGDVGLNTGGMGAYSPAPFVDDELQKKIMDEIMLPTVHGMANEGMPYRGFLYAGLMISDQNEPKVLEFNCRFGDPETQPIMMRLSSDLVELIQACFNGTIESFPIEWDERTALGVVIASSGYPEKYATGFEINGLDATDLAYPDVKIFHSGTAIRNGKIVTNGGRVLCVTALGRDVIQAQKTAYDVVKKVAWDGAYYRKDIGDKAVRQLN
jgi:phosphoribosylamine--glycine ligase